MVITLLGVGLLLLILSAAGLSTMNYIEEQNTLNQQPCGMLSPDSSYQCALTLGHNGWCSDGNVEWHDDAWNIGWFDETVARKQPTLQLEQEQPAKTSYHALRVLLLIIGVVMVAAFSCGRVTATPAQKAPADPPTGVVIDCGTPKDLRYFMTDGCPGQKQSERKFGTPCRGNTINCLPKKD